MATAAAAADHILKNGHVSTMIRHGFISPPASPVSRISPAASPPPAMTHSTSSSSSSSLSLPSSSSSSAAPSTTLFDMIAEEERQRRQEAPAAPPAKQKNKTWLQDRITAILAGNRRSDLGSSDVELTVISGDGFRVSMSVHRSVLTDRSRFFAEKLNPAGGSATVEICECDDAELYVEAVALMYSAHPGSKLPGQPVPKILALLKVCAAMLFEAGVAACVEHLECAPWSEEEQDEVVAAVRQLRLPQAEVLLARVSADRSGRSSDKTFLRLLGGVLHAKDEKARQEMKNLIKTLLREEEDDDEDAADISKETLFQLCRECIRYLLACASDAGTLISREAENVLWLVELLVRKGMGAELVWLWADQKELARVHAGVPCMQRYEISRVTAEICAAAGRGRILVHWEAKAALLTTWLAALYEDFGWMRRAARGFDRKLVEDGLGQMILTLPMEQQGAIFLDWFDRFLEKGDDCPNIQTAFQIWWRRAFFRQPAAAAAAAALPEPPPDPALADFLSQRSPTTKRTAQIDSTRRCPPPRQRVSRLPRIRASRKRARRAEAASLTE